LLYTQRDGSNQIQVKPVNFSRTTLLHGISKYHTITFILTLYILYTQLHVAK